MRSKAGLCLVWLYAGLLISSPAWAADEEATGDAPAAAQATSTPAESSSTGPAASSQSPEQAKTDSAEQSQPVDKEKKITLHFPDTDIRLALETISAKVGVGIIAGPEVKGKVSIKLEEVPWEKGLDIMLKTYGFTYVWEEGVIRVLSRKEMAEMGMQTRVFKLRYAEATEVEKSIRVVMSKDGAVQASRETKTIIVKDTPENLKNIESLIQRLEKLAAEGKSGGEEAEEEAQPTETKAGPAADGTASVAKKKKSLALDFKEVPIREAVAQISALSGVYISVGEEVKAVVTLSTAGKEVPWQMALKEIIASSDLAYEPADVAMETLKAGDFIRLRTKEKILEKIEKDEKIKERVEVEHVVVQLKYIDAVDIQKVLETQLTARGKITILAITGQAGWKFASEKASATLQVQGRESQAQPAKSRTLLLSDIPSSVRKMLQIIEKIDIMPYQIIIETKFVEVSTDFLKDHGFDLSTGQTGLSSASLTQVPVHKNEAGTTLFTGGGKFLSASGVTPTNFTPIGTGLGSAGIQLSLRHLFNTEFDSFLRIIQEDVFSNVLSAPKVMTLNNQEATIVVGTKFPIVTTTTTTGSSSTTTVDLKYYQDIGVRMNVIPQVSDNRYINMILHPAITSQTGSVTVFNSGGFQIASYPILTTREAETQVLMKDGETIVLGGLIQDKKFDSIIGVPILNDIPFLGPLFARTTTRTNKIDLLIFITSYLVRKGPTQMAYEIMNTANVPAAGAQPAVQVPDNAAQADVPGNIPAAGEAVPTAVGPVAMDSSAAAETTAASSNATTN